MVLSKVVAADTFKVMVSVVRTAAAPHYIIII